MPQVPGNTISGAGGYGSYPGNLYRDRYDWIIMPGGELRHVAFSAGVGLVARNPYVSGGLGVLHGLSHMFKPGHDPAGPSFTEWITGTWIPSSPGGGGPGQSLTSTTTPPSTEEVGRMITAPRPAGRGAARRKCPKGHHWSSKLNKCVRNRR